MVDKGDNGDIMEDEKEEKKEEKREEGGKETGEKDPPRDTSEISSEKKQPTTQGGGEGGAEGGRGNWGAWLLVLALTGVCVALVVTVHALNTQLKTAGTSNLGRVEELEAEVSSMMAKLQVQEEEKKKILSELSVVQGALREAEVGVELAKETHEEGEKVLAEEKVRVAVLEGVVARLEAAIGVHRDDIEALKKVEEAGKEREERLNEVAKVLQSQRDELLRAAEEGQKLLNEAREGMKLTQKQINDLEEEKKALEEKLASQEQDLQKTKDAMEEMLAREKEVEARMESQQIKEKEDGEKEDELVKVLEELRKKEETNQELTAALQKAEVEASASKGFLQSTQERLEAATAHAAEMEARWQQAMENMKRI